MKQRNPPSRTHRLFFNVRILFLVTTVAVIIVVVARNNISWSAASPAESSPGSTLSEASKSKIADAYAKLPLSFEKNNGQTDQRVKFISRGPGYELFLTPAEAVLALHKPHGKSSEKFKHASSTNQSDPSPQRASVLRLTMIGANRVSRIEGEAELPGKINYFMGNDPEKWRLNIPTYRKVRYRDIYPGVDVVYYGNQRQLEYDFVLAAGANPANIRFKVEGADRISLDQAGDLRLRLKDGDVKLHRPLIYQVTDAGVRHEVKGEYVIRDNEIGFKVRGFDSRKPLVIDPVLSYSTLLGAGGNEYGFGIAVDSQGNAYVTGVSDGGGFPTTPGAFQTASFGSMFVSKLDATGSNLIYSTYLGGRNGFPGATGTAIAVDASGSAYVTGFTQAADFPTVNPIRGGRYNLLRTSDAGIQWDRKSIGSVNAPVLALAIDKVTPSTIYAGTSFGSSGIFKSTDSGNSWTALNTGFTSASCASLIIDPTNSSILYAALNPNNFSNPGVYKSTDAGSTWTLMSNGLSSVTITALAIDPQTPSTLYAGTAIGLYKTTNAGVSWVSSSSGLNFTGFTSIVVDPSTPATVYATAGGGGVFKTTNGGGNWGQVNSGLTNTVVRSLVIDPNSPSTLFAGTAGGGVFKSTNGGGNWSPVNNGVPSTTPVNSAVINPSSPSTIYIGTSDGRMFKTTNGGDSWITVFETLSSTRINAFAIDPGSPSNVYAGSDTAVGPQNDYEAFVTKLNADGSGIVYSTYLGGNGSDSGYGIALDSNGAVHVVGQTTSSSLPAVNANQPSFSGADGCSDGFVMKLNAAGSAFVFSTYLGGNGCDTAYGVAVDSTANVYVTGTTRSANFPIANAFQSTLGDQFVGDAFVTKFSGNGPLVYSTFLGGNGSDAGYAIAVDLSGNAYITGSTGSSNYPMANPISASPGGIFVTKVNNSGSGLVYSTYLGGSSPTDAARGIAVDSAGNAYITGFTGSSEFPVVAGALRTKSPIYKTRDEARSWTNLNYGLKVAGANVLAVDPTKPSTVYAGTGNGVYKSTDGGGNWTPINNGLIRPDVRSIVIDPITPSTIYLAIPLFDFSASNGVYKSIDGGNNWTAVNNGLANKLVLSLAISPSTPSTLFVGTYGSGIYKTTDGGSTWTQILPTIFGAAIAVDPFNPNVVYAGEIFSGSVLIKSLDGGTTWNPTSLSADVSYITIDRSNTSVLYASGLNGAFKSIDAGASWQQIKPGFAGQIAIDPSNSNKIYLLVQTGSDPRGVLKSTDGGNTFATANNGLTGSPTAIAIHPFTPSIIYVAAGGSGGNDAFVTKINASGTALIYSTLIGGNPAPFDSLNLNDEGNAIALDSAGNAYVVGQSRSPDFPVTSESYQPFNRGFTDVFITKLTMSYSIRGQVLDATNAPVSGAEVILSDGVVLNSIVTDSDGSYEFSNLREGGNFTVSASKPNFLMAPPSQTFNNLNSNQTLNFTATSTNAPFYTVSGQLTDNGIALSGATVTVSGSQLGVRTTDSNGNYAFTLAGGGNYTLTPSLPGFTFTPPSQTFNNLSTNQIASFAATRQSFVVTNTKNHGTGSLRQAILNANATIGLDQIIFNIPGSGVQTINLLIGLPPLTDPVVIDGTTQPGYAGTPLVELNGAAAGSSASGFVISAAGCTIRGFVINGFNNAGISAFTYGNNVIQGNYIGIDPTGTLRRPNHVGINLSQSSNNTIGGTTSAARNVISANSFDGISMNGSANLIQGNFIGTNAAGTAELGNGINGVEIFNVSGSISDANLIGGTTPGATNIISGNQRGISAGSNTVIQGNLIGTDLTGTQAVGNNTGIEAGSNTLVGGTVPAARNLISGNGEGVRISGPQSRLQGNLIGTDITGTKALGNIFGGVFAGDHAVIGGTSTSTRNVISGNAGLGNLALGHNIGGDSVTVQGNYIGTDVTGSIALLNPAAGITVSSSNNVIGGSVAGTRNIISGNTVGIQIGGLTTAGLFNNVVQGNFIGVNAAGNAPLPNSGDGVRLVDASGSTIGGPTADAGNTIAFNGASGVFVSSGTGNSIRGNSIFSNAGLGIDLNPIGVNPNDSVDGDTGANARQNFPVLTSVLVNGGSTTIQGSLNSIPNTSFKVDLYSNGACDPSGNGEGAQFFNTTTVATDSNGNAIINATFPVALPAGRVITATATDLIGNTSEFSPCSSGGGAGSVQFSVSSIKVIEDIGVVTFTVLRQGGSFGSLTVDYSTSEVTATAGQDYTPASGTLSFGDGETTKSFEIQILDDATTEPDETFAVLLRNASTLESLGVPNTEIVTIQDHSTIPILSINSLVNIQEGNSGTTDAIFTVTLSAATGRSVAVNYSTSNSSATGGVCGNVAVDYETKSGTLSFPRGETSLSIPIKVCGETSAEANETFFVNLSNPTNAALANAIGVGRILNDDILQLVLDESGPAPNQAVALDSLVFVRDPFHVLSIAEWIDLGSDRNTRVMIFASNLQLNQGEPMSAVLVNLVGSNGQSYDLPAESVRAVPDSAFTQVVFRLPNNLASGVCQVRIRAHGHTSNTGTFRIAE